MNKTHFTRRRFGFIPHPVRHNYWRTGGIPPHGRKRLWGFTIMELIIVVVIIGVLAAIALPSYRIQMLKMKNQEAIRILMTLWEAQRDYFRENGVYTNNINDLALDIPTPLKNFANPVLYADDYKTCNYGPKRKLAALRDNGNSYTLDVLEEGRVVCDWCGSSLCKKMGFMDDW